jgi:N-acylglucosamine 2-epimerase
MSLTADNARAALCESLQFWLEHGNDPEHGGLLTHLDQHGNVFDTDKSIWAQGRWAYVLGRSNALLGHDDERAAAAASAWSFLQEHGFAQDGSMYFSVTSDGRPLRHRRYVYSACFAAMAAAQLGHASKAWQLLDTVWARFDGSDAVTAKTNAHTRPMIELGLPMIVLNVLQVFRETIGDAPQGLPIETRIDRCIDAVRPLVHDDEAVVLEVASPDGSIIDHAQGRQLNPGHAIEAASFVLAEGLHRSSGQLQALGLRMVQFAFDRGWDPTHGGLTSFVDVYDQPCVEYRHDMKFWWPQFESLVALLRAHACTGERHWWEKAVAVYDWIETYVKDPNGPEYFGYLAADGTPSCTRKGDLWKGAFHIPRALQDVVQILSEPASTRAPSTS